MSLYDPSTSADPTSWSLVQAAAALRTGRIGAQDYAAALLTRCAAQAHLNAFTKLDETGLMAQAQTADAALRKGRRPGPLHGIALALKDNIAIQDWPTSAGTAAMRHWVPAADAAVVGRLVQAGALLAGKTTMHELAMGWTGQNMAFGDTCNPHDPRRMSGGSSGGSACAVAAGMVPGAIGTDTNGSARVPSAFCGSVGLRPTQGRYPMAGVVPLAPSLDTLGPMGRHVADVALLDAVMAGVPPPALVPSQPTALRLGICRDFWDRLDNDVAQAAHAALERLQRAGVQCVPVDLPQLPALVNGTAACVIRHEAGHALGTFLQSQPGAPALADVLAAVGSDLSGAFGAVALDRHTAGYRAAMERRERLRRLWATCFEQQHIDALFHPAVRVTAPLRGEPRVSPGPEVATRWGWMSAREAFAQNATPASLVGAPSLALPARFATARLPVGMQLDGWPGGDRRLLSVAAALEPLLA